MSEDFRDILTKSATSALIDEQVVSDASYKPSIIYNNLRAGHHVLSTINRELEKCNSFSFAIAFVTCGGLASIHTKLKELEEKGVKGRLITTTFLAFNDPETLKQLLKYPNLSVRIYDGDLHIKGYIFHNDNNLNTILIGSSNLTQNALKSNLEWNLKITSLDNGELLADTISEYEKIWSESVPLTVDWIDKYSVTFEEYSFESVLHHPLNKAPVLTPYPMQRAAIDSLFNLINQGENKAIIISATGTGKTFISAFFAREYNPKTMLFLIHRENILDKAKESYELVIKGKKFGKYMGNTKEDGDYLFASTQTMYNHLQEFDPHQFELIVCDEAHHVTARQYRTIVNYFKPKFLMGMTATPERTNRADVYGVFDNNIAYEVRLNKAMEENLVSPFHYYGISELTVDGKVIDEESDFAKLVTDERVKHLLDAINEFPHCGNRIKGLIFCKRTDEGAELSRRLNEAGLRTASLDRNTPENIRKSAIEKLESDSDSDYYDFLITVDIFNEGVDIPSVNMVVMMRPTQSAIIFVQQLGRGLRKANKEFLTVIDFIGNYKNNYMIPIALFGDTGASKDHIRREIFTGSRMIPGASTVDFDKVAKERIFASINSMKIDVIKELGAKYEDLEMRLKRVPGLYDLYAEQCIDPRALSEGHLNNVYRLPTKVKTMAWNLNTFRKLINLPHQTFTDREDRVLFFLTNYLTRATRPYEGLILKGIIENKELTISTLEKQLKDKLNIDMDLESLDSACSLLSGGFVNGGECSKYPFRELLTRDKEHISITPQFAELLSNPELRWMIDDVIKCNLEIFRKEYSENYDGKLSLYAQYTRRDFCVGYNYSSNCEGVISGYQIYRKDDTHSICPIFVTYAKSSNIRAEINYDDKFLDNSTLSWVTKHGRRLDSREIRAILEGDKNGMLFPLFVQRNDAEDKLFYYLGLMHVIPGSAVQKKQPTTDGKFEDIVNMKFKLEIPIRDDLYKYLIS